MENIKLLFYECLKLKYTSNLHKECVRYISIIFSIIGLIAFLNANATFGYTCIAIIVVTSCISIFLQMSTILKLHSTIVKLEEVFTTHIKSLLTSDTKVKIDAIGRETVLFVYCSFTDYDACSDILQSCINELSNAFGGKFNVFLNVKQ